MYIKRADDENAQWESIENAFTDITFAFEDVGYGAEELSKSLDNFVTGYSMSVEFNWAKYPKKERRALMKLLYPKPPKRKALLHNGKKPRK